MNRPLQMYDVHPTSIRLIKKGHPWILKDQYTEKFQPRERFIIAQDRRRPFSLLLHDPRHSNVKARVWSKKGDFQKQIKSFRKDLSFRITNAIKKRKDLNIKKERENLYLIFGEADHLPGIKVTLLYDQILVQLYSYFWENYEDNLIDNILSATNKVFNLELTRADVWKQYRADKDAQKKVPTCLDPNCSYREVELNEFGIKYSIALGKNYDPGLYTDMSSVRSYLKEFFQNSKSVLNLYAYTGAFSLFALKSGAEKVVSVDLSESYIKELESNIRLNDDLNIKHHKSMISSVADSLNTLQEKNDLFDMIVSDPPSSSSDGHKRTNALKDYESQLPKLASLLNPKGHLLLFLNTHKISKDKFKQKIEKVIEEKGLKLKIVKHLKQAQDCPGLKGFPEGSYLKGILLQHD